MSSTSPSTDTFTYNGCHDIDLTVSLLQLLGQSSLSEHINTTVDDIALSSQSSSPLSTSMMTISQNILSGQSMKQDHLSQEKFYEQQNSYQEENALCHSPSSSSLPPSPRTVPSSLSTPTNESINSSSANVFEANTMNERFQRDGYLPQFSNPFHSTFDEICTEVKNQEFPFSQHSSCANRGQYFEKSENSIVDLHRVKENICQYQSKQTEIPSCFSFGQFTSDQQQNTIQSTSQTPPASSNAGLLVSFSDTENQQSSSHAHSSKVQDFKFTLSDENRDDEVNSGSSLFSSQGMCLNLLGEQRWNQNSSSLLVPIRKRQQSKTYEDIMPYLSTGISMRQDISSSTILPPFLKRSKTSQHLESSTTKSSLQHVHVHFSEKGDQNETLHSPFSLDRRRQRSKTSSIVYPMNSLPIVPLSSQFSQIDRSKINAAQVITNSSDITSLNTMQETMCKFVAQAARTALKSAKISQDTDGAKRAVAGSKARDEQNREKSKRYYDRKKAQSFAMSSLHLRLRDWFKEFGLETNDEFQQAVRHFLDIDPAFSGEQQKMTKKLQKGKEAGYIEIITLSAKVLNRLLKFQSLEALQQVVVRYGSKNNDLSEFWGEEQTRSFNAELDQNDVLNAGLCIWLDFLSCWSDLVLAEKRLKHRSGEMDVYHLINHLKNIF